MSIERTLSEGPGLRTDTEEKDGGTMSGEAGIVSETIGSSLVLSAMVPAGSRFSKCATGSLAV